MFEHITTAAESVASGASRDGAKGKIGVLIEDHFDPTEFWKFNGFFPAYGYEVEYISHLWNNKDGLRFGSNPENDRVEFHVTVTKEIDEVDLADYCGIILIGAYAMDRLRYEEHPKKELPNQSPAVRFLRKAMNTPGLKIGTICHSLWLFCAAPDLLKGRKVTCAHNLISDVGNAGGDVQFGNDGTVPVVVDGNLISGKHPAYVDQFLIIFLQEIEKRTAHG
jgi:putative intracellular protease/amidase